MAIKGGEDYKIIIGAFPTINKYVYYDRFNYQILITETDCSI